jgi:hypothetical protein
MDGRIDPPAPPRQRLRRFAMSTAVIVARIVCVVAGLGAYGVSVVGFLGGSSLGVSSAIVGTVLLVIGLWRPRRR